MPIKSLTNRHSSFKYYQGIIDTMKKILILTLLAVMGNAIILSAQKSDWNDFYNTDRIQDISIRFKQKNWKDVLDSLKLNGEEMLIGSVRIGVNEYKNAGIRYRGSKSFKYGGDRNSFQIKLNHIDKEQNHQGYKKLNISNALRDPSMVREVLGFEIARKYMHAPKANYTRLTVNGEYRGLFTNIEYVDDHFLNKHFGSADNTFFKCSRPDEDTKDAEGCMKKVSGTLVYEDDASCYMNNYEIKSENGWDDLIGLTKALDGDVQKLGNVLDVDQVLWMHAFNNVLANLNSYAGDYSENYYLYQDKHGRFVPIPRDMNLCFGSYKNIKFKGSYLSLEELQELDPFLHADNNAKPLISKLLKDPYYRKVYVSHVKTIMNDNFSDGQYEKRAKELQKLITNDMFRDKFKYYDHNQFLASLTKTTGKKSKIPGIVELMDKRAKFLKKHAEIRGFAPEIGDVEILGREKFSNKAVKTFILNAKVEKHAKKVRVYYRFNEGDIFQVGFMKDDGNSKDGAAGDKLFGLEIKPTDGAKSMEYYLVAENAVGTSSMPSNYMFKPLKVELSSLNQ